MGYSGILEGAKQEAERRALEAGCLSGSSSDNGSDGEAADDVAPKGVPASLGNARERVQTAHDMRAAMPTDRKANSPSMKLGVRMNQTLKCILKSKGRVVSLPFV